MKGSRLYFLFLFAFFVIVFVIEITTPHQFVWKPTYDKFDKEPFGSYVFDDILSSSIDNYSVVNKTLYQIFQEDSVSGERAFLVTERNPVFGEIDIEILYKFLHLGNHVMICTDQFSPRLRDTLHFGTSTDRYNMFEANFLSKNNDRDSIFFGTDTLNPVRIFEVFPHLHPVSIELGTYKWDEILNETSDSPDEETVGAAEMDSSSTNRERKYYPINCDSTETLVWGNMNKPLVARVFIGKGELFLVSTPLMFTNFGMLDGANASYAFQLLSYMKDRPLIRIESYGVHGDKPQTPLRYILSETSLRWATYAGLTLLILFMAFTAKRRQRIIPVVMAPRNRSFGFIQLISNLYFQKHNNIEILKMKYMYFSADVKNLIGVELYEQVPNESDYERLIEKTGIDKDFIHILLYNIRQSTYREEVNDLQLKQYIDGMNTLLRALKN